MIYVVLYAGYYLTWLAAQLFGYRGKALAFSVMFVYAIFAFIRGEVGTDTASYERLAELYSNWSHYRGSEPFFFFVINFFQSIFNDPMYSIRFVGALTSLLLLVYFLAAKRNERYVFQSLIFPMFFCQFTMNVERIGLATAIFMVARQIDKMSWRRSSFLLQLISLLTHYSASFYVAMSYFAQEKRYTFLRLAFSFSLLIALALGASLLSHYFFQKLYLYEDFKVPAWTSGLRSIVAFSAVIIPSAMARGREGPFKKVLILSAFLFLAFLVVSRFSYAGLRMLDLIVVWLPLWIAEFLDSRSLSLTRRERFFFVLGGGAYAVANVIGYLGTAGIGSSPFLPYVTFFQ